MNYIKKNIRKYLPINLIEKKVELIGMKNKFVSMNYHYSSKADKFVKNLKK